MLTTTFENALRPLRLAIGPTSQQSIAKKIIELAQQGERVTVRLRERAIEALSGEFAHRDCQDLGKLVLGDLRNPTAPYGLTLFVRCRTNGVPAPGGEVRS